MGMFEEVYAAVRQIPRGRVATYGQIARMIGRPRAARVVGYALSAAPADVPCHRVVSRQGGLSEAFSPSGRETMTSGGPDGSTEVFLSYMYKQAYTNSSYGYGMAIGVVVFAFSFALSAIINAITKRDVLEY